MIPDYQKPDGQEHWQQDVVAVIALALSVGALLLFSLAAIADTKLREFFDPESAARVALLLAMTALVVAALYRKSRISKAAALIALVGLIWGAVLILPSG